MSELITGDLSTDEQETIELAGTLLHTGNLHPLIALLRGGEDGLQPARDALRVVGEFDVDMLVRLILDLLIDEDLTDPARGCRHDPRPAVACARATSERPSVTP